MDRLAGPSPRGGSWESPLSIDEGDVFHLCDYELRFTYRAD
jgi:hypothetical protein